MKPISVKECERLFPLAFVVSPSVLRTALLLAYIETLRTPVLPRGYLRQRSSYSDLGRSNTCANLTEAG